VLRRIYKQLNATMTAQEIIDSTQTKTAKMLALFELGYTRVQVAEMMGVGYGFVQNVYARRYSRQTMVSPNLTNLWTGFSNKFGVEIEAHGVGINKLIRALNDAGIVCVGESYNHETRNHWKIVSDASVSGEMPFELVSPPLVGEAGLAQLKIACDILEQLGAKINKSCGLHIHFDVSEFDINAWKNLYINYAKLEQIIDSIMPVSRRGNNNRFCQSLRVRNYEDKIRNAETLLEIERSITDRSRYYKLNTQSYWRQRTVEFRQHSGTIEYGKVSNWILILSQMLEYSKSQVVSNGNIESLNSFLQHEQQMYVQQRIRKFATQ
jgi:hypothetical protein